MKRLSLSCVVLALSFCASSITLGADVLAAGSDVNKAKPLTGDINISAEPEIVERGQHQQVIRYHTFTTNDQNKVTAQKHEYTVLGNGINYWDGTKWVEADETIQIVPGGAIAHNIGHKITFAADINTRGSIQIMTPDNQRLVTQPIGIAYISAKTGKSVMFATVKSSNGRLIEKNKVLYSDCFDGEGVKGGLRYTVTKAGFAQDLILEAAPSPEECGLVDEDEADIRMEVWTEFLQAPVPTIQREVVSGEVDAVKRQGMVEPDLTDDQLNFSEMHMVKGVAFDASKENALDVEKTNAPVYKTWFREQETGRQFLIEKVEWLKAKECMKDSQASISNAGKPVAKAKVSQPIAGQIARVFPPAPKALKDSKEMIVASLNDPLKGMVLDYEIVQGATNFCFDGNKTYFVPRVTVDLYGATVFESGSIIKYTNLLSSIRVNGSVECQVNAYRPVVFTSIHDDSVGEVIQGSTGKPIRNNGSQGPTPLDLEGSATNGYVFTNIRIRYAYNAILTRPMVTLQDSQLGFCWIACSGNRGNIQNSLFYQCENAGIKSQFTAQNCTFSEIRNFGGSSGSYGKLTNCLVVAVTNGCSFINGCNNATNASPAAAFQTAGAGQYYLADGSTNRNAGTTNITPSLLASLRTKTTYPPTIISNVTFTTPTVLQTTDTNINTGVPDIGYCYDALDYIMDNVCVSNTTLTLAEGVKVGISFVGGGTSGINLRNGSILNSTGSPLAQNYIVRLASVQEQSNYQGGSYPTLKVESGWTAISSVNLRFTQMPMIAANLYHVAEDYGFGNWNFRDCEFWGGQMLFKPNDMTLNFSWLNNHYDRVSLNITPYSGMQWQAQNNLFRGGTLNLNSAPGAPYTWTFKDNLFDKVSLNQSGYVTVDANHNAYVTNYARLQPTTNTDLILTNSPTYAVGPLGSYYLPTNSCLIDAGSVTNAGLAGLYHYTTLTNQVKETNSILDCGFHYVALGTNNVPVDSDGDGLADYLEDTNGNGVYDSLIDFSNFNSSDSDSDGLNDQQESNLGRSPKTGSVGDTNNVANLKLYTPLKP